MDGELVLGLDYGAEDVAGGAAGPADPGIGDPQNSVEVAVDAPGATRTYSYAVPDRLAGVEAGEAVLVEFGRGRQALGVVLGRGEGDRAA